MKKFSKFIAIAFLLAASAAHAEGVVVYDPAAVGQAIKTTAEQELQRKMQEANFAGKRAYGDLLNDEVDRDLRRYAPRNLDTLLKSGGVSGEGIQSSYQGLKDEFKPLTSNEADKNYSTGVAYERQVQSTFAALSVSEQAYNNSEIRTANYERLLEELGKTEDLKSSIDLQTRAIIESGLATAELVRLTALQMQLAASASNNELAVRRKNYDMTQMPTSNQ